MITVTKVGEEFEVSTFTRAPSRYLDHWALRLFSSDSSHRKGLLAFFRTHGILLFSWANVLEISRDKGRSLKDIQDFLTEIGEHRLPLEINPIKVIERETFPGSGSPCFGTGFLESYYPHIHDGPLHLRTIVDLVQDDEFKNTALNNIQTLSREVGQLFGRWPSGQSLNKGASQNSAFDPDHSVECVLNGLIRLIEKENFNVDLNDPLDFLHTRSPLPMVILSCWTNIGLTWGRS